MITLFTLPSLLQNSLTYWFWSHTSISMLLFLCEPVVIPTSEDVYFRGEDRGEDRGDGW